MKDGGWSLGWEHHVNIAMCDVDKPRIHYSAYLTSIQTRYMYYKSKVIKRIGIIGMSQVGFIFTRCVQKESHAQQWVDCYNKIREFYPTNQIIIIDDYSNPDLIVKKELVNTLVFKSNLQRGAGEILPYYYFYNLKNLIEFDRAFILHDSMFFNKHINIDPFKDEPVKFLWHFEEPTAHNFLDTKNILLENMKNTNFHNAINNYTKIDWIGCFGSSCFINIHFLEKLQHKYDFLQLAHIINDRNKRSCLERIFALLCIDELKPDNPRSLTLFGNVFNIHYAFYYTYENYKNDRVFELPIVKVWNSR